MLKNLHQATELNLFVKTYACNLYHGKLKERDDDDLIGKAYMYFDIAIISQYTMNHDI